MKRSVASTAGALKRTRRSTRKLSSDDTARVKVEVSEGVELAEIPSISSSHNVKAEPQHPDLHLHGDLKKSPYFEDETITVKVEISDLKEELIAKNEPTIKTESDVLLQLDTKIKGEYNPRANLPPSPDAPNIFTPIAEQDSATGPKNWATIYNRIVDMRALVTTPVDSMGCERMPTTLNPTMRKEHHAYRFQLLISLMLSAQTKDEVNYEAMVTLQGHFRAKGYEGICLQAILESTEAEIDECIKKVGFHRKKAVYIKKSCELLKNNFGGDIPKTIEEIVTLPGVGPKMGHLLLQNGWGINMGIGVDAHIHRLAQMWGWVKKTENPDKTRIELESWLPRKYWAEMNPLLVGFGQTVCVPRAGNCDVCTLSDICSGRNRKLINSPFTEKRVEKLTKLRGDLSKLVALKLAGLEQ